MKKTTLVAAALASALAAGVPLSAGAQPLPGYAWGGHSYCFYQGWHGPGWYWCGYGMRRGFGWGGPAGWHGWRHDGRFHGGGGFHGGGFHGGGHGGGFHGGGDHGGGGHH